MLTEPELQLKEIDEKEIIGRTIKDYADSYDRSIILTFEDNTFIMIHASSDYGGGAEITLGEVYGGGIDTNFRIEDLIRIGMYKKEDVEQWQIEKKEIETQYQIKQQRETYERLKKQFGE